MTIPRPRTSANLAALFLACITCVITNVAAAAIFPFFSIVASKQTNSTVVIGFVFAIMKSVVEQLPPKDRLDLLVKI